MSEERITAQDLRDFQEGREGPALDLYTHCLTKLVELLNPDLRRIFMADLINHATGKSTGSMQLTFQTFAKLHHIVSDDAGGLDAEPPYVEPV